MDLIIFAIVLLVTNVITGFLVFKGVQLGLRWQVEVRQERPPTMDSPLEAISKLSLQTHPNTKGDEETKSIVSEWFNGAEESR